MCPKADISGADKFTSMKTEIVPFVDKNYKTNSDRGIFGHSFGVCLQLIVWWIQMAILLDLASVVLHFGGTMRVIKPSSYSIQGK
jgi:hypothetical protein